MQSITLHPIATVSNGRLDLRDDDWGDVISEIHLRDDLPAELLVGLESFSHVEVLFVFDQVDPSRELPAMRHPRDNQAWPKIGLLAQRSAYHPNPIGLCSARILGREGSVLTVQGLDAVNGTPVLDLKPVFREFQANNPVQPGWVSELLRNYW